MFATTARVPSTAAVECQPKKIKKTRPIRHHGRTVVNATVRGNLLQHAVQVFDGSAPSFSLIFHLLHGTLSPSTSIFSL